MQLIKDYDLTTFVESMNETKGFNFENLRRKIRPHFKTTSLNNQLFSITRKHTKKSIAFSVETFNNDSFIVSITFSSKHSPKVESLKLVCSSHKEFMTKIIFTYNLFD
jgi:hypothetical protein